MAFTPQFEPVEDNSSRTCCEHASRHQPYVRVASRPLPITSILHTPDCRRGFTTVRDAGGADWGLAQAVEEGTILGPRLLFTGHALSQTGGHGDMRGK